MAATLIILACKTPNCPTPPKQFVAGTVFNGKPIEDWFRDDCAELCKRCRANPTLAVALASGDKHCPTCGAKVVEYKHSLSVPLVEALVALCRMGRPTSLKDLGLSHNHLCNFQKLRYWGLVAQTRHAGVWEVTDRGLRFALAQIEVSKSVWTYRGIFRRYDGPLLKVTDVVGFYQPREDWARQAQPLTP